MESEGMNMDNVIKQNEPLKVPDGALFCRMEKW